MGKKRCYFVEGCNYSCTFLCAKAISWVSFSISRQQLFFKHLTYLFNILSKAHRVIRSFPQSCSSPLSSFQCENSQVYCSGHFQCSHQPRQLQQAVVFLWTRKTHRIKYTSKHLAARYFRQVFPPGDLNKSENVLLLNLHACSARNRIMLL